MSRGMGFKSFYEKYGVKGVRQVALAYALEDDNTTIDELCIRFQLTRGAVEQCKETAIVNCFIDFDHSLLIMNKSRRNQIKHITNEKIHSTKSDKYYKKLFQKRFEYVKNLPVKKVREIAYLYMENHSMTCKELAKELYLSEKELCIILERAIIEKIVEDPVMRIIFSNSLMKCSSPSGLSKMVAHFKGLERKRNEYCQKNLKERLVQINSELEELYRKANDIENFVSSSDIKYMPSKDSILNRILYLEKEKQRLLSS